MKKFKLGQLVVTRAVADRMQTDEKFTRFVQLSLSGDTLTVIGVPWIMRTKL